MAGYSKLWVVGREGGFQGTDGVTDVLLQIWVGDGNRQWLEPHYFRAPARGIANVKRIVPAGPDDPNALIDACIAFYPGFFRTCPSMAEAELVLHDTELLDFDMGRSKVSVGAQNRPVIGA
ncbi:MAG: hypothetical protein ACKO23_06675 [Gemmataceae bacterium]